MKDMTQTHFDIIVNGETVEVAVGQTLAGLITQLGLNPDKAAAEHNLTVIPRSQHGETVLQPGDKIEMIEFVGGG